MRRSLQVSQRLWTRRIQHSDLRDVRRRSIWNVDRLVQVRVGIGIDDSWIWTTHVLRYYYLTGSILNLNVDESSVLTLHLLNLLYVVHRLYLMDLLSLRYRLDLLNLLWLLHLWLTLRLSFLLQLHDDSSTTFLPPCCFWRFGRWTFYNLCRLWWSRLIDLFYLLILDLLDLHLFLLTTWIINYKLSGCDILEIF